MRSFTPTGYYGNSEIMQAALDPPTWGLVVGERHPPSLTRPSAPQPRWTCCARFATQPGETSVMYALHARPRIYSPSGRLGGTGWKASSWQQKLRKNGTRLYQEWVTLSAGQGQPSLAARRSGRSCESWDGPSPRATKKLSRRTWLREGQPRWDTTRRIGGWCLAPWHASWAAAQQHQYDNSSSPRQKQWGSCARGI